MKLSNLTGEPLLHFVLIGAALFGLYAVVGGRDAGVRESENMIVVSAGRIEQLGTVFSKTWQRPPTEEELRGLVDDFVLEEIYYRQAIAMGIDRDDTVIRRRLRQKLEFLTDDVAAQAEPTDEDLAAHLAANATKFRRDPQYTFQQVYINPKRHGKDREEFVQIQLKALRAGTIVNGDSALMPGSFDQASRRDVDRVFGKGFSEQIDTLSTTAWVGPVRSGLGLHLIRLEKRVDGRLPELSEIRSDIEREWVYENREAARRKMNEGLLGKYEIEMEWPQKKTSRQAGEKGDVL